MGNKIERGSVNFVFSLIMVSIGCFLIVSPSQGNEDGYYVLQNKNVKYYISTKSGRISRGWKLTTGEKIVSRDENKYYLVSRKDSKNYREKKDRIISSEASSSSLTLKCRNEEIDGLSIKKEYRLDGNILKKKGPFLPERERKGYFLTYTSSSKFNEDFWKDGLLYGRDALSHLGKRDKVLGISPQEIKKQDVPTEDLFSLLPSGRMEDRNNCRKKGERREVFK